MSIPIAAHTAAYPSAARGWTLVILLTLAYIVSYIDRSILGLLIQPIKADLGLTDKQIGWIIGPAFGVFYATMGLPLGWLVDRGKRTWIVGAGIVVWSIATALCGFAKNFVQLFCARMAVGIGEATLSPAAFSMISDSFPPERRGKPIAFYAMALSLGAGIGSLISAYVIPWAKSDAKADWQAQLPMLGDLAPWQLTFIAVGLPGLLLAVLFFFLQDPSRRTAAAHDPSLKGNGLLDALGYVARHWSTYLSFVLPVCAMTIIAYSQQFMAPTFERTWGWPAQQYAMANAIALILIGPATVMSVGFVSDRMSQIGVEAAPFRLMIAGFLLMLPTAILPYFMPTPELAFGVLCINTIGIGMMSAANVNSLLLITPAPIRGQIVAMFYVTISVAGLFLGPTTVGKLSTDVFGEANLRLAMASVPVIYGMVPLLLLPFAYRRYVAHMKYLGSAAR